MINLAKSDFNMKSGLMLVLGVFLVLAVFNMHNSNEASKETDSRAARPIYDGAQNNFQLEILDTAEKAIVDELYWVDLRVRNPMDGTPGSMYVQCSILDRSTNPWIQSTTMLSSDSNCVVNEPFTKTAKVYLDTNTYEDVKFTMITPNTVDKDNVVWCQAFEKCATEGTGTDSDTLIQEVLVLPRYVNESIPVDEYGNDCTMASDCNTWFWEKQVCVNGYCMDAIDTKVGKQNPPATDIKGWVVNNKMIVLGIAIGLVVIGAIFVYKDDPKVPKFLE